MPLPGRFPGRGYLKCAVHSLGAREEIDVENAMLRHPDTGSLPAAEWRIDGRTGRGLVHFKDTGRGLVEKLFNNVLRGREYSGRKPLPHAIA